jgi:hypothetical protein
MKKIVTLFIILILSFWGYSQVISGTVVDKKTSIAVPYATVYFNGTFNGTHTNEKGYFELEVPTGQHMPLTVSALGYSSLTFAGYLKDEELVIYLHPKVYELDEVIITSKVSAAKRKTYLNMFRKEFLGTSPNALSCKIENEKDIRLSYDPVKKILKAFCKTPVIINNKSLGYRINYYLDTFEFSYLNDAGWVNSGLILGNFIFTGNAAARDGTQRRYAKRRKEAYLGSRMHFFRALWDEKLETSGFVLQDSAHAGIASRDIVFLSDSIHSKEAEKYLKFEGRLFIHHNQISHSFVRMLQDSVYFDKNGYYNPTAINWNGSMANQRIGDLLPYEYMPDDETQKHQK